MSILVDLLHYGRRWQDLELEVVALKKEIYEHESEFDDDDEFCLRLGPHISIMLEKLYEQWNNLKNFLNVEHDMLSEYKEIRGYLSRLDDFQNGLTSLTNAHSGRIV